VLGATAGENFLPGLACIWAACIV